jgi:nicotinate phosphoribosyltransferase
MELVMYPATSPLLTDLYQLNMLQAYLDHGRTDTAVFEFFVRRLPARRGFLKAAGLEQALGCSDDLTIWDSRMEASLRDRAVEGSF